MGSDIMCTCHSVDIQYRAPSHLYNSSTKKCLNFDYFAHLNHASYVKKVKQSHYRPGVAKMVTEINVPRFHDNDT
jgi:hypothetical protein